MRCKFKVDSIDKTGDSSTVAMSPVHSGSETDHVNREQLTLSGGVLVLSTTHATAAEFRLGVDYYVEVTRAQPVELAEPLPVPPVPPPAAEVPAPVQLTESEFKSNRRADIQEAAEAAKVDEESLAASNVDAFAPPEDPSPPRGHHRGKGH
jgi:hypothetical protein